MTPLGKDRGMKLTYLMSPLFDHIVNADTLVDFGCGVGDVTQEVLKRLSTRFPNIIGIGIDNSTDVVEEKLGKNLAFWRGDVNKNEIPEGSADIVLCLYIMQVLGYPERSQLFEEIKRVLAPGGSVIFLEEIEAVDDKKVSMKGAKKLLKANSNYLVQSDENWKSYIEEYGFKVEEKVGVEGGMAYRAIVLVSEAPKVENTV